MENIDINSLIDSFLCKIAGNIKQEEKEQQGDINVVFTEASKTTSSSSTTIEEEAMMTAVTEMIKEESVEVPSSPDLNNIINEINDHQGVTVNNDDGNKTTELESSLEIIVIGANRPEEASDKIEIDFGSVSTEIQPENIINNHDNNNMLDDDVTDQKEEPTEQQEGDDDGNKATELESSLNNLNNMEIGVNRPESSDEINYGIVSTELQPENIINNHNKMLEDEVENINKRKLEYLNPVNEDDNLPKQRKIEKDCEQSVASFLKPDYNARKFFIKLLKIQEEQEEKEKQKKLNQEKEPNYFHNGCVNVVLSYLNNFQNDIEEKDIDKINVNSLDEYKDDLDDLKKIWHAEMIGNGAFGFCLKVTKRNEETRDVEYERVFKIVPNATMGTSEAVKGAKLTHPNIVKVYNALLIRHICCIEMEFIGGGNLEELMNNKVQISKEASRKMLFQCMEALILMKHHRIVHSDIKPANIMIRDSNNIAVGDFGMSVQSDTISKQVMGGTKSYMATELKTLFKPTFLTDLYSLGKTFQELVAGCPRDSKVQDCIKGLTSTDPNVRQDEFYKFAFDMIVNEDEKKLNPLWAKEGELNRFMKEEILKNMESISDFRRETKQNTWLKSDKPFILAALKKIKDWGIITRIHKSLKKDSDIIISACKQSLKCGGAVQDVLEVVDYGESMKDSNFSRTIKEMVANDRESKQDLCQLFGFEFSEGEEESDEESESEYDSDEDE